MSKLTFKGNIVHGEKYTDRQTGEEKWKNTNAGALFHDEEKDLFKVKLFDSWFTVWPPKVDEEGYQKAKKAVQATPDPGAPLDHDERPF